MSVQEKVAITLAARWREHPGLPFDKMAAEWAKWGPAIRKPWLDCADAAIAVVREDAAKEIKSMCCVAGCNDNCACDDIAGALLAHNTLRTGDGE